MIFEINRASKFFDSNTHPHEKAYLDENQKRWLIEINTIEELVNLDDSGVVVIPANQYNPIPTITIYDGYIE